MGLYILIQEILGFLNFDRALAIFGVGFGIWHYRKQSELKNVVNNKVKRIYKDSKAILDFAKKENNYNTIKERARSVKTSIVELDVVNRNLDYKKIDALVKRGELSESEGGEYKYYTTSK